MFWTRAANIPRQALFLILAVGTSVPLFFHVSVPNRPAASSIGFYRSLMALKPGSTVLLGSDWTYSTRGESGAEFESVVNILMDRGIKFALYSMADPQAPQIAKEEIAKINMQRVAHGEKPYVEWNDFVNIGYYVNVEGSLQAFHTNLRSALANIQDAPPGKPPESVLNSPVLKGLNSIYDIPMLILITASTTSDLTVQRLPINPQKPFRISMLVTGVMGPQTLVYYQSKQIVGLINGLKGDYDLETMMKAGLNTPGPNGQITVNYPGQPPIPPLGGYLPAGMASRYYPTLHVALILMILMVILGNVGMFAVKRRGAEATHQ